MTKFTKLINSEQPVLVDFFAEWCGPCKTMLPVLKEVAGNLYGKARIIKVDIDKNPDAASKYEIRGVPTMILFQKGEVKWRQSGVIGAAQLTDIITRYIRKTNKS